MKITRENYEAFLLDRLEGNLDPLNEQLLVAFLEKNPDLNEHLEKTDLLYLSPDLNIIYPDKSSLKKRTLFVSLNKYLLRYASVAAVLCIAVLGFLYWQNRPVKNLPASLESTTTNSAKTYEKENINPAQVIAENTIKPSINHKPVLHASAQITTKPEHNDIEGEVIMPEKTNSFFTLQSSKPDLIESKENNTRDLLALSAPALMPVEYSNEVNNQALHGVAALLAYNVGNTVLPESISHDLGIDNKTANIDDITLVVETNNKLINRLLANVK